MSNAAATPLGDDTTLASHDLPLERVRALLETVDKSMVVADREGLVLVANARARKFLAEQGKSEKDSLNIFSEMLHADPQEISQRIQKGEHEIELAGTVNGRSFCARVKWIPESDWLVIQFVNEAADKGASAGTQLTVQELLQEREITYRNLLAAYLKLQEVNRQKTVFLASAAHELKTPLAVIKGYYDLLLTGSLGRLTEKQKDILEESKESCERLVRLVSMFLNYSALESGKLVLQLRENDLRDCLDEVARLRVEAFQKKRREAGNAIGSFDSDIPIRLSEGATGCGKSAGQCVEAYHSRGMRDVARQAPLFGSAALPRWRLFRSGEDSGSRARIAWR